jgi:hypothetical protein
MLQQYNINLTHEQCCNLRKLIFLFITSMATIEIYRTLRPTLITLFNQFNININLPETYDSPILQILMERSIQLFKNN